MHYIGIFLALVLFLVTANSTFYFLGVLKVSPLQWLVFNACAPSNLCYLVGFLIFCFSGNRTILYIAILPMFFFGTLGLFLFPWGGFNLIAQISHILMTLNIAWTVWSTFNTGDYKAATVGMLLGVLIFAPFIGFQQMYVSSHPEALKKILGIDSAVTQQKSGVNQ